MPNTLYPQPPALPHPQPARSGHFPMQGMTVLVVEDSRFACDALRLICQRAGARMRRAENLAQARAHLRVYLPDIVLVDLGLPDGRGEDLIRELANTARRPKAILASSGDLNGAELALSCGADGYLEKPLTGVQQFYTLVAQVIPALATVPFSPQDTPRAPDLLALQDDLQRAAQQVSNLPDLPDPKTLLYLSRFIAGLAQTAGDTALAEAASRAQDGPEALSQLRALLTQRSQSPYVVAALRPQ